MHVGVGYSELPDTAAAGREAALEAVKRAGRAAGYAGSDLEDALEIQRAVADRVPLLGMYTGVEIASVRGRPRGLDWTGVFCLFSVPQ